MKKLTILFLLALIILTFSITCKVFDSRFALVTIDYFAFFAGLFLIVEGMYKLTYNKSDSVKDKILKGIRVVIGTCVFTIHLLQFMKY